MSSLAEPCKVAGAGGGSVHVGTGVVRLKSRLQRKISKLRGLFLRGFCGPCNRISVLVKIIQNFRLSAQLNFSSVIFSCSLLSIKLNLIF